MEEESAGQPVDWRKLVSGVIVGWVLSWATFFAAVMVTFAVWYDSSSPWSTALLYGALFAPALVLGVVTLGRRRRGQFVAGTWLGLTIGSIAGAGVCSGWSGFMAM